jgi:hypothetical protein
LVAKLKRKTEALSWKQWPDLAALLLGGASLATHDPVWFQLEISIIAAIVLVKWAWSGRSPLTETDLSPFQANVVGEYPSRLMTIVFVASLAVIPVANLFFALQFSETLWLLFRTLAFSVWLAGFAIVATWLAGRKAEREA